MADNLRESLFTKIVVIIRRDRVPLYYKLTRLTLELPFNIEGADLPTSASNTKLTTLLLPVWAVSSEGCQQRDARTALRPYLRYH